MVKPISRTLGALLMPRHDVRAQAGPPDGSTPEQQAVIANDPPFRPQALQLTELPRPVSAPVQLFNGRNLAGWHVWLGYADPRDTYGKPEVGPIGLNNDKTGVFRVVTEDGRPAIYSSGKNWGGLMSRKSYRNYHLRLQFKWRANAAHLRLAQQPQLGQ